MIVTGLLLLNQNGYGPWPFSKMVMGHGDGPWGYIEPKWLWAMGMGHGYGHGYGYGLMNQNGYGPWRYIETHMRKDPQGNGFQG